MSHGPVPQTITAELIERIHTTMWKGGQYLSPDDLSGRRMLRDAEKLQGVSLVDGLVAQILISVLYGDADAVRTLGKRAESSAKAGGGEIALQTAQALVQLGYYSEAQGIFLRIGFPECGQFSRRLGLGATTLAMLAAAEWISRSDSINVLCEEQDRMQIQSSSNIFLQTGVKDAEAAALLDLAGEIMRDHRVFVGDQGNILSAIQHYDLTSVFVEIPLNISLDEIAQMNFDLASLISIRVPEIPSGVMVAFSKSSL